MDVLIQTRIPKRYGDALAKRAKNEGVSLAALLRRMAMQSVETKNEIITEGWVVEGKNIDGTIARNIQQQQSHYRLGLVEKHSSTELVFRLYKVEHDGKILRQSKTGMHGVDWYGRKDEHRFVLSGGSIWKIVSAVEFDRGDAPALELTLAQERA